MISLRFWQGFRSSGFLKGALSERKITLLEVARAISHWPAKGSDGFPFEFNQNRLQRHLIIYLVPDSLAQDFCSTAKERPEDNYASYKLFLM